MDDKETSCQGSNFGDFKSVDEVVRFYKLPNQKTKTSRDKVNSFSKSVCQCQKWASDLDSPLTFMPKYKILSLSQLYNCFYGHYVILGKKTLVFLMLLKTPDFNLKQ